MDNTRMMVMELGSKGYSCAQIILLGGLRLMGKNNPDVVRAMAGLAQGGGCSGELCGALSGGLCLIGLHTGKGKDTEMMLPEGLLLMDELVAWFRDTLCNGGAITCASILDNKKNDQGVCRGMDPVRCSELVAQVWDKVVQMLAAAEIDPREGREEDI